MFWVLLAHIGIPFIFGLVFMLFSIMSSPTPPSWAVALDTAFDLAILGIGATAAIFENPIVVAAFREHAAEVGIIVIAVDSLFFALIALIRRYVFEKTQHKLRWGVAAMTFGIFALLATSSVLAYSYHVVAVPSGTTGATSQKGTLIKESVEGGPIR
jgi:hypothetical protein